MAYVPRYMGNVDTEVKQGVTLLDDAASPADIGKCLTAKLTDLQNIANLTLRKHLIVYTSSRKCPQYSRVLRSGT